MKINKLGKYVHIKKICSKHHHLEMLAIDQRPPIFNIIKKKKKNYGFDDVVDFKKQISETLSKCTSAILMDPVYSIPNLLYTSQSNGLIITLEDHLFTEKGKGRYSKNIQNWTVEKIKKMGGDAVKVLAWYRPDSDKKSIQQQQQQIPSSHIFGKRAISEKSENDENQHIEKRCTEELQADLVLSSPGDK